MKTITNLGIPKIKALGLNNTNGIDNSQKKSLSIRYISCDQKGILLNLRFEITTKELNNKESRAYVNVFRGDAKQTIFNESVTSVVEINPNGKRVIDIAVPLSFGDNELYKTNKYFRASISVDGLWALSEGFKIEFKDKKINNNDICYCQNQGLTNSSCKGNGKSIVEEMYINLAKSLGVEKEILLAIGRQESGHDTFVTNNPKKANILLERHYVYRLLKEKYGKAKADSCKAIDPTLCHENKTPKGEYGSRLDQLDRLEKVKKWDESIAIESCSWGKFQTMGEYITEDTESIYKNLPDFENAMNMCEVQQFKYFTFFMKKIKGKRLIDAMKNKDWEGIAKWYNGGNWKDDNPNYASNIKKYYEEFKNH